MERCDSHLPGHFTATPITSCSVVHYSPLGPQILQMSLARDLSLTSIISRLSLALIRCFQWAIPWICGILEYTHLLSQPFTSLTDSHSWLLSLLQLIILKIACFVDVFCLLFIVCLCYMTGEQESEFLYYSLIPPQEYKTVQFLRILTR